MSWLDHFTWPRTAISDLQRDVAKAVPVLQEIRHRVQNLEMTMADVSPLLTKLASDLRTWTAGPYTALLARNAELEAREAARGGLDATELANESTAGADATSALNELIAPVTASPDVPVEIPPVDVPADPTDPAV